MFPLGHMAVAGGIVWSGAHLADRAGGQGSTIAGRIDYRLVMLGALLPDLVDKPIGGVLFSDAFDGNGHLFGHTLLFGLILLVPGLALMARSGDLRLLAVAVADLTHLLVDPTNHSPETLLWPLLGTDFPDVVFLGTALTILEESVAALLFVAVAWSLFRGEQLAAFVQSGRL